MDCGGYLYLVGLKRGSGRYNRKWGARTGRVEVQQAGTRPVRAHYFLLALPLPRFATSPLCHFTASTQPGINTLNNHSPDIIHSHAYEVGTDSEFQNVGN